MTRFSHGAGCACKLSPDDLRTLFGLVRGLVPSSDDNLLVGHENSDDAAVYRLRDDLAIVFTTDFFTPIVDDAFDWGRIAAANALSDIYAMGGTPLLALNLVAWPREGLPLELLARVIDGGAQVVAEADAIVAGGHSIDDSEPKFGMAVVGTVDPKRVFRNVGALPGDLLVLTKPIGLGVISTAIKRDAAPTKLIDEAIRIMTTLNADARDAAVGAGDHVHAVTDVTGFSLLGHLNEMVATPGIGAMIEASSVPVIDGVRDLIKKGMVAGGTQRNHAFVSEFADWGDLAENEQLLLTDAQTSGGLLIAVAPEGVDDLVDSLKARGTPAAAVIGRVVDNPASRLIIT
ncbi:MAG: selenide, water dikinase SelD [Acidimicrobiia bacterium]|nr:selenide, water dikinase SelD [Acidimicrobiia bacterium]